MKQPKKLRSPMMQQLKIHPNAKTRLYMTREGYGNDLIHALTYIITPEELIERKDELRITNNQIHRLKVWLKNNCDIMSTMKELGTGYDNICQSLFDNNSWGILTKIRRYVVKWQPYINKDGYLTWPTFYYIGQTEVLYKSDDVIIVKRKNHHIWHGMGRSSSDTWYERNPVCMQKINGEWQYISKNSKIVKDIFNALKVMDKLIAA
jgi:hypothetical protein